MGLGVALAISADTWRALPAGLVGVGHVPSGARLCAPARSGRVRRRRRRPESLSEQLDSRQGLRHGPVRAPSGERGHRRRSARRAGRLGVHLRANAREHGALAPMVALRERGTGVDVRAGDGPDDLPDVDAGALDALRHAGPAAKRRVPADRRPRGSRKSPARGSACCSGRPVRFRFSRRRWGSPTTRAGWLPTS